MREAADIWRHHVLLIEAQRLPYTVMGRGAAALDAERDYLITDLRRTVASLQGVGTEAVSLVQPLIDAYLADPPTASAVNLSPPTELRVHIEELDRMMGGVGQPERIASILHLHRQLDLLRNNRPDLLAGSWATLAYSALRRMVRFYIWRTAFQCRLDERVIPIAATVLGDAAFDERERATFIAACDPGLTAALATEASSVKPADRQAVGMVWDQHEAFVADVLAGRRGPEMDAELRSWRVRALEAVSDQQSGGASWAFDLVLAALYLGEAGGFPPLNLAGSRAALGVGELFSADAIAPILPQFATPPTIKWATHILQFLIGHRDSPELGVRTGWVFARDILANPFTRTAQQCADRVTSGLRDLDVVAYVPRLAGLCSASGMQALATGAPLESVVDVDAYRTSVAFLAGFHSLLLDAARMNPIVRDALAIPSFQRELVAFYAKAEQRIPGLRTVIGAGPRYGLPEIGDGGVN